MKEQKIINIANSLSNKDMVLLLNILSNRMTVNARNEHGIYCYKEIKKAFLNGGSVHLQYEGDLIDDNST